MWQSRAWSVIITATAIVSLLLAYFLLEKCWYSVQCADMQSKIAALFPLALILVIFSIVFFFTQERVFQSWIRYNFVMVPIGVIAIIFSPVEHSGFLQVFPDANALATIAVPVLYILALLIFLITRRLRRT